MRRPTSDDKHLYYAFKDELTEFGWDAHREGWTVQRPEFDNKVFESESSAHYASVLVPTTVWPCSPVEDSVEVLQLQALEKEVAELRRLTKQTKRDYTAVLFHLGDFESTYLIIPGDHSKYDECYLNWFFENLTESELLKEKKRQERLTHLIFDDEGKSIHKAVDSSEFAEAIRHGAKMIVVGYQDE